MSRGSGRAARVLTRVAAILVALALSGAAGVYALSERALARTYAVPQPQLRPPTGGTAVARGAHLATAVANCVLCHGEDLGGKVYADAGALGVIAGPNLTRGRGGIGAAFTDADWVRAIRHGVRRDGTSLIVMPSETYVHLSDRDLGALVAYLKQLPPVDRTPPPTRFGPLGRVLLASGRLPLLVAPKTPRVPAVPDVPPDTTAAYGRYLADVGGCRGCHGLGLSGGRVAGPDSLPRAANLTPAGLGGWTEADFVRAMREGRRPDGSAIDAFMPWPTLGRMTDAELRALWRYLERVPPRPTGTR